MTKQVVPVPVEEVVLGNSKQTASSSKSAKLKPAATELQTTRIEDDPNDKDFIPPKHPRPRSESPIEGILLDKHGNEIVEDLPLVPVCGFPQPVEHS